MSQLNMALIILTKILDVGHTDQNPIFCYNVMRKFISTYSIVLSFKYIS